MAVVVDDNELGVIDLLVREAKRNRLYGSLEIKYENGNIVLIRKTETLKPTGRNNREEEINRR